MNVLAQIVVALFVPATYLCIQSLGPRRGGLAALLGGWMFLPVFDGRLDLPLITGKASFVPCVVLTVALLSTKVRPPRRLHWMDLVAAALCVLPAFTAVANGLGIREAISAAFQSTFAWGTPYAIGRLFFGDLGGLRVFARWLVGAAVVYVPLCLWEIRMSPQLHRQLYGFRPYESFEFAVRYGGYRPSVFMQFGLMVGTFMATATLVAYWLWRKGEVKRLAGMPAWACVAVLAVTTVLVKATGSILLMVTGIGVLEATRVLRRSVLVLLLVLIPPVFVSMRIGGWDARQLAEGAALIGPDRAESVGFRIQNEKLLVDKALRRPWLGWGRFGRSRVYDESGRDISVTDSMWVIQLGGNGLLGLVAVAAVLLVPTVLLLRRVPARHWAHPAFTPAAALTIGTVLYVHDSLLNAMMSPLFPAICGATITFVTGRSRARSPAPAPSVA